MTLWKKQLAQRFRGESSLARRCLCPLPTAISQRVAHTMGRYRAPKLSRAPNLAGWTLMPVVAAAASTRPASTPSPDTESPGHGLLGTLPFSEDEYVQVAQVAGVHGVRGELRLELSTDQPRERFRAGKRLYLLPPYSARGKDSAGSGLQTLPLIPVTARGAKMQPRGKGEEAWVVALEEVTSRTQVEQLRGYLVYCAAADRGPLRDPDEFYVTDIIGCTVIHQATRSMVGLVVDVYGGMGTHDTLRVKLRANEEDVLKSRIRYCMIPFAKAICPVLDLTNRTLEVAPPEGLLDLVTEEKLKKPLSDEAKAKKLAQLRETLAGEAASIQQQQQQRNQAEEDDNDEVEGAASATAVKGGRAAAAAPQQQQQQQQGRRLRSMAVQGVGVGAAEGVGSLGEGKARELGGGEDQADRGGEEEDGGEGSGSVLGGLAWGLVVLDPGEAWVLDYSGSAFISAEGVHQVISCQFPVAFEQGSEWLVTFVLGWAISTVDKFQVLIFADSTQRFFQNEGEILRLAGWRSGIPTCLAPLSRAMERELPANVRLSPGEVVGRDMVMSLLAATKKRDVVEALRDCSDKAQLRLHQLNPHHTPLSPIRSWWQDMWMSASSPTAINLLNNLLGPTALLTFDEWLLLSSTLNATLAASGRRSTIEATLQFLLPIMPLSGMQPGWLALVPDTPQVRAFAAHMSATTHFFDDVFLGVFDSVTAAMDAAAVATEPAPRAAGPSRLLNGTDDNGGGGGGGSAPKRALMSPGRLWAVLEFTSGPDPGVGVDYAIRMNAMHVPGTFSKLSPTAAVLQCNLQPECQTCNGDFLAYMASGFMSLQAAVAGYVLGPSGDGADRERRWSDATAWLTQPNPTAAMAGGAGNRSSWPGHGDVLPPDLYGIWFTPLPNMGQERNALSLSAALAATVNAFYEYGAPLLGILTTCSFSMPLMMLVRSMTSQRQSGLQHLLRVVGLSSWEWQLAWMWAGVALLAASFGAEALLAGSTYLHLVQPGLLATVMAAAAMAAAAWGVLLGCCFQDAKVAATGSFTVTLAAGLPFLALYNTAPTQLLAAKRTCCLMWPFALSVLLQRMAAGHQLRRYGGDRSITAVPGLEWGSATHGPLSSVELIGFLLLDAVLYLAVAAALAALREMAASRVAPGASGSQAAGRADCTAVLEFRGVTHRYRGAVRPALDDVSFTMRAGEAVALLGRNAAGKSTLMAVGCGRMTPSGGGTVRVSGCSMYGSGGAYQQLGYCPQGDVLLPDLTAWEHLQLALTLRGGEGIGAGERTGGLWGCAALGQWFRSRWQLRAAAAQLARRVSLPEDMLQGIWGALLAAKQGPWGEGARRGGARGVKGAGEDPDRPAGRGAALLFISHHLPEVEKLADMLAVMEQGRLESLKSAAALHSLLKDGAQRVLRITTRPAPPPPLGPPAHPATGGPVFTRSQLRDMIVRHLGVMSTRVLYSNWTFTAVYMESVTTAAADSCGASLDNLESLVRQLQLQQPPSEGPEGDAGSGPVAAIATSTLGGAQPSAAPALECGSGWEAQPLVVTGCGVDPPSLEDVLLLGLGSGSGGAFGNVGRFSSTAAHGATGDKAQQAIQPNSASNAGLTVLAGSAASTVSATITTGGTSSQPVTSVTSHSHASATFTEALHPQPRSGFAGTFRGSGGLLADLIASLPPLLTKQRLTWLRDLRSSARLLLLPVVVVGVAIVALSIRPPSTGPPAPLNLAWLGQHQPTPTAGLPSTWLQAAAAASSSGGQDGGGLWNAAMNASSPSAVAAAMEAGGLAGAGVVPLRAEWIRAAADRSQDPDKGHSSADVSTWFWGRSRAAAAVTEPAAAKALAATEEPSPPLHSAMVFGDAVAMQLNRTAWSALGWVLETMLVPTGYEPAGEVDLPELHKATQVLREEPGALWKMADFLYDRILLHEVISLVRYVRGSAQSAGSRAKSGGSSPSAQGLESGEASLGNTTFGRQPASRSAAGLFSFFQLGNTLDLCQLEVPGMEQDTGGRGKVRRGGYGRRLLMSFRPSLNVSLYLLAGLLPPEQRFCSLAKHLVEHSHTSAQLFRSYKARRSLPALNLMWNVSSPHGPPAVLNHLHNTIMRLRSAVHANTQLDNNITSPVRQHSYHHQQYPGVKDRSLYGQVVYSSTPIRVHNHPLPARGTTSSIAGLLDHMLLALMVALPLSYTTGSFVVRAASEAASGAKQQQLAAGRASPLSYWLSFWLADLALHAIVAAAVLGLMLLGGTEAFVGTPPRLGGLAALLMAYASASLPWGYCIGLYCTKPASAQGLVSTVSLLTGVGLALARQVLAHVRRWSWLGNMMLPLLRLLPPFCLVDGLIQMSLLDVILALSELLGKHASRKGMVRSILEGHLVGIDPSNPSPFQRSVLGDHLSYLAFDAVLYGTVLVALEWKASRGGLFPAVAAACPAGSLLPSNEHKLHDAEYGDRGGGDATTNGTRRRRGTEARAGAGDQGREAWAASWEALAPGEDSEAVRECLVRVHDVYKMYGTGRGRVRALQGLSFELREGQCLALIGRNGAGKSTALAVLSGRLRPSGGSVVVGGVEVAGRPEAARARVALCPQTNPLLPFLTAAEHLTMYSTLYGMGNGRKSAVLPAAVATVASRCGLPSELLHRPAGQLSGGSQRKLSLAIALLGRPQLLLLDEPSAGLDPPARRDMCDTVNMAVRGWAVTEAAVGGGAGLPPPPSLAVVLTTHYAEEAAALCDLVGVLDEGILLACGPPEHVPLRLKAVRPRHYLAETEEWGPVLTSLLRRRGRPTDWREPSKGGSSA
ncbi:hypothetical protein VOLCADRAFT_98328 [Volvox carteri f. nagariensis]|uniref:ABC transporter domain-containing protein n=1 Tax=Volvox carteri f. nagariensis TaxID=3068 RepID=D8UEX9_VOLCA|nr:uncharacterized protein VOLCADRAFT_98328 [Volvox carteri f. nagariensis]EFJ41760.1 hypothetical protein VOLCADRAFT_98328 [Volvox carteri f. nagariensis]|eukprot:XP_002957262.1 hypothetical protein VOLCADRAFT_98328 [Volvox carteri f. nagariensis]